MNSIKMNKKFWILNKIKNLVYLKNQTQKKKINSSQDIEIMKIQPVTLKEVILKKGISGHRKQQEKLSFWVSCKNNENAPLSWSGN